MPNGKCITVLAEERFEHAGLVQVLKATSDADAKLVVVGSGP